MDNFQVRNTINVFPTFTVYHQRSQLVNDNFGFLPIYRPIFAETAVFHKKAINMCKIFVYVKYTKPIDELCFICYNTKHQQEAD